MKSATPYILLGLGLLAIYLLYKSLQNLGSSLASPITGAAGAISGAVGTLQQEASMIGGYLTAPAATFANVGTNIYNAGQSAGATAAGWFSGAVAGSLWPSSGTSDSASGQYSPGVPNSDTGSGYYNADGLTPTGNLPVGNLPQPSSWLSLGGGNSVNVDPSLNMNSNSLYNGSLLDNPGSASGYGVY